MMQNNLQIIKTKSSKNTQSSLEKSHMCCDGSLSHKGNLVFRAVSKMTLKKCKNVLLFGNKEADKSKNKMTFKMSSY